MVTYKQLLDLGFERNDCLADDQVYLNQHGFECFWLEKFLYKDKKVEISLEWEPTEGKMELIVSKKGLIKSRREITEEELLTINKVFDRDGALAPTYPGILAC